MSRAASVPDPDVVVGNPHVLIMYMRCAAPYVIGKLVQVVTRMVEMHDEHVPEREIDELDLWAHRVMTCIRMSQRRVELSAQLRQANDETRRLHHRIALLDATIHSANRRIEEHDRDRADLEAEIAARDTESEK